MSVNVLPPPRRITASNLPLPSQQATNENAEPGVEVRVDILENAEIPGSNGVLCRARVATEGKIPTSNDGHGEIALHDVPGAGIVLPGGANIYYIDVAPNVEGTMHRTTSTDYLVVISGTLTLLTPAPKPFSIKDGKPTYGEPVATELRAGDVVAQRGIAHALSNRTNEWVRVWGIVLDAETNKVPVDGAGGVKELEDAWYAS
ncbi:hypothetical protein BD289DRAFT_375983 [Coniella lustricola]|uniref:Cupin 2 conserved barrel domain-containing protein n=1 Tax=Coniella lustricola TaxID=2025994 RepID=A0A2T2ZXI0_9PEZI|nr:hypothetical protein BD289DRAFT_375983 [Coniella lustricola]